MVLIEVTQPLYFLRRNDQNEESGLLDRDLCNLRFTHDFANEALPPLLHKFKKDMGKKKEEQNRSVNMTTGKVGEPLARIGF